MCRSIHRLRTSCRSMWWICGGECRRSACRFRFDLPEREGKGDAGFQIHRRLQRGCASLGVYLLSGVISRRCCTGKYSIADTFRACLTIRGRLLVRGPAVDLTFVDGAHGFEERLRRAYCTPVRVSASISSGS